MADIITTLKNRNNDNLYPMAGGMMEDSIMTAMLKDYAVTRDKLANLSVNTDKIADGAVTTPKIADDSITSGKLSLRGANVNVGSLELYHNSTPYIDFHYANSSVDHTARIINDTTNSLNLIASGGVKVNGSDVLTRGILTSQLGTATNAPTLTTTWQNVRSVSLSAGTYILIGFAMHNWLTEGSGDWSRIRLLYNNTSLDAESMWNARGCFPLLAIATVTLTAAGAVYLQAVRETTGGGVCVSSSNKIIALRIS